MSAVLYEPAFAVITACFGADARKGITTLTLPGGLASTVFWPLTQALVAALGWRHAVLVLALFNLMVCAPLHWWFLPKTGAARTKDAHGTTARAARRPIHMRDIVMTRKFVLLALAFTANMLAFSAMSIHLITLLNERGLSAADAVLLAAIVGPMQVLGRIGEYTIGKRFSATQIATAAIVLLPIALLILQFSGTNWMLMLVFVTVYGISNGIITIVRGVIPAEIFGRERYGAINGALAAPVLAARSMGPLVAAMIWSFAGGYDAVIWTLAMVGLVSALSFHFALKS
jgi:predicted MFS family arabinose efflux permease